MLATVPLVKLALTRFHSLTHAERAMLAFAEAGNRFTELLKKVGLSN